MTAHYFDNAATTPVRPEVVEAMMPFWREEFGNPSSQHEAGSRAANAVADARARVALHLGVRAGDVLFTSGGTEGNNLAVKGIAVAAAIRAGRRHVVTSAIEHESILESVSALERVHGFSTTVLGVDANGRIDPDAVADAIRDDTALVSIGYANNEVGTVQPVAEIAALTAARRVPLHLDAVQAAGWLPLAGTGSDAMTIAGHKLGAPKGTGAVAIRGRIPVEPLFHGGGQERGRRSGTENVAGAVGLAVALDLAEAERQSATARISSIRDAFVAAVLTSVPSARLTGHPTERLAGSASFTFEGTSGEAVLLELERRGYVSSSGSACAAGSDEPSHVLIAMGISPEVAQTSVRFTFSHDLHESLDAAAGAVAASVTAVGTFS